MEEQPPPSQQDAIFWRQSLHLQADRIQKSRYPFPVLAQITGRIIRATPDFDRAAGRVIDRPVAFGEYGR